MTNKHTKLPWRIGRISSTEQTVEIDAPNGHDGSGVIYHEWDGFIECVGSVDAPSAGIEIAEANARHIVHCVNNYDRLREALREVSELDYMSMENAVGWLEDNCRDIRALLDELDNMENQ